MGCSKALIIAARLAAVLSSAACLSAVAEASLLPVGPLTSPTSVATAAPVAKPQVVTASTPQFSCPNCVTTSRAGNQTIGQSQAATTIAMNLGSGAFVPQHLLTYPIALTSYAPAVTYVTSDQAEATQAASMVSATFSAPDLMNDNGDVDPDKLGEYMVDNTGISGEFEKHFFGSDTVGTKVLKTESYTSPFTAANAINEGDDS